MKIKFKYLLIFLFWTTSLNILLAQNEQIEKISYYQMEPLNDSLFITIQKEIFIDPQDPKAEIIVDLRDQNNQTVSIKGVLYPLLSFKPETRASIISYPFKVNLEEQINFGSVFTRVIGKLPTKKILAPPTRYQITSTLSYINPFFQLFGGERFGIPIKGNLGVSVGLGTPYSFPLETNFVEANFHLIGFYVGIINHIDALTDIKSSYSFNNLYITNGYQVGYVIPLGNFFEFNYQHILANPTESELNYFDRNNIDSLNFISKILRGNYYGWEFRYPVSVLGSTRAKLYVAKYLGELHIGFTGRELSLIGSTFDISIDAMPSSDVRQPEYFINLMVQRIGESWATSAFAIGPSIILSRDSKGKFYTISAFLNMRVKVGTSL